MWPPPEEKRRPPGRSGGGAKRLVGKMIGAEGSTTSDKSKPAQLPIARSEGSPLVASDQQAGALGITAAQNNAVGERGKRTTRAQLLKLADRFRLNPAPRFAPDRRGPRGRA
jgi:hypothetical protein